MNTSSTLNYMITRSCLLIVSILFFNTQLLAQKAAPLPRSTTPEAQGISSDGILNFLEAAGKSDHEFHSFMVVRHGKVVAEGWWNPYRPDLPHTMYSVSKSFAATAVGFAVSEKRLSVDDKVISFFPEDVPDQVSPNLAKLRIRDLLSMSVGQKIDATGKVARQQNWVKAFFNVPIVYEPGTKFLYNSAATYMLSAIVQKVTGQKIIDYLEPRLFKPLGIKDIDWETDPRGVNVGGWGLRLKTEDMAKFGQLFLQKGKWNGKQILPASWVEEATTMKIMQDPDATQAKKDSSDWLQGYCYQMWRSRNNSYRGDGAFGQFILVLPEKDAVIAITAETSDMQKEFDLIWKHLVPAMKDEKLPANKKASEQLKQVVASLALPIAPAGSSTLESKIDGKMFRMFTDRKLHHVTFDFEDGVCQVAMDTDSTDHDFVFGGGTWKPSETTKYGPYLVTVASNNRVGLSPFKVTGSYSWTDNNTLALSLRYLESPHWETIVCKFEGDEVSMDFQNFFNENGKRKTYDGLLQPAVSNPAKLIVRGDDMGFSHSANHALIKSYKEGIETSIEVIVPSPWFPEAVKLLKENPGVDVGLHFAITSEWDNVKWRPVTEVPSLENEDGYFYPMIYPNKNYPKQSVMENSWKPGDIERELRAQIKMAKKYIPRISHISGHMNSTAFTPEVKELCKRVAAEYNLKLVDADQDKSGISNIGFDFGNKSTEERIDAFIEMLDKLEPGKTYVYVEHPAFEDSEMKGIHHVGYDDVAKGRQDVTTIFTSDKVKEALLRKGIQLVSYKDVLEGK